MKKSGCYKGALYKFRYDSVPEYNLWTFRDNMSTFYFPYENAELSANPKIKGDEWISLILLYSTKSIGHLS